MYTHSAAESTTECIVLHSCRPAVNHDTLTLVHLYSIIHQPITTLVHLYSINQSLHSFTCRHHSSTNHYTCSPVQHQPIITLVHLNNIINNIIFTSELHDFKYISTQILSTCCTFYCSVDAQNNARLSTLGQYGTYTRLFVSWLRNTKQT